jgi:F-type H+-transporting ATPase subunit b
MFVIVFVTLKKWAYKPMIEMLEKRRKTIAQGLEDAQVASEARANAEKEAEKIIADARAQAAELIRAASEQLTLPDVISALPSKLTRQKLAKLPPPNSNRNVIVSLARSGDRWPPWPLPPPRSSSENRWMKNASMLF